MRRPCIRATTALPVGCVHVRAKARLRRRSLHGDATPGGRSCLSACRTADGCVEGLRDMLFGCHACPRGRAPAAGNHAGPAAPLLPLACYPPPSRPGTTQAMLALRTQLPQQLLHKPSQQPPVPAATTCCFGSRNRRGSLLSQPTHSLRTPTRTCTHVHICTRVHACVLAHTHRCAPTCNYAYTCVRMAPCRALGLPSGALRPDDRARDDRQGLADSREIVVMEGCRPMQDGWGWAGGVRGCRSGSFWQRPLGCLGGNPRPSSTAACWVVRMGG